MKKNYEIKIPSWLNPEKALQFAHNIRYKTPEVDEYCYNFNSLKHCPPFGLLVVLNAIRYNMVRFPNAMHYPYPSLDLEGSVSISEAVKYVCHLGLFQHCGWNEGRKTIFGDSTFNCIPIMNINNSVLMQYKTEGPELLTQIEAFSHTLALRLTRDQNDDLTKLLTYCFREIIRNTFEHGEIAEIWVCGQFWPQRNRAEIALMDQGCGILRSLSKNTNYDLKDDEAANLFALEPGVSKSYGEKITDSRYQNSGFGLYVAKSFGEKWGTFVLASGNNAVFINSNTNKSIITNIKGTCVCLALDTSKINNISVSIDQIVQKGESIARGKAGRINSASKASSIISLKKL